MLIDPRNVEFAYWAALTSSSLSTYGQTPVNADEDAWQDFARAIMKLPTVAGLNVPDPVGFEDWREWAGRLNEALRPLGL